MSIPIFYSPGREGHEDMATAIGIMAEADTAETDMHIAELTIATMGGAHMAMALAGISAPIHTTEITGITAGIGTTTTTTVDMVIRGGVTVELD